MRRSNARRWPSPMIVPCFHAIACHYVPLYAIAPQLQERGFVWTLWRLRAAWCRARSSWNCSGLTTRARPGGRFGRGWEGGGLGRVFYRGTRTGLVSADVEPLFYSSWFPIKLLKLPPPTSTQTPDSRPHSHGPLPPALAQVLTAIGSLAALGDPVGLLRGLAQGASDAVSEPLRGFNRAAERQDLGEIRRGFARGASSLAQKTVDPATVEGLMLQHECALSRLACVPWWLPRRGWFCNGHLGRHFPLLSSLSISFPCAASLSVPASPNASLAPLTPAAPSPPPFPIAPSPSPNH